ncbi:hypothetical protein AHiyo4_17340 [Arthrobacter sp. Hiyo4]|nr:hypothetical protein AHiyo4_17340 [Arthrobacter sp. Hiyo4]
MGTVFVGIATVAGASFVEYGFAGNRAEIRGQACGAALESLIAALSS